MKSNNILAWGSAQLFFMLSVLVAVVFAILSNEMVRQLGLDASDLGLLGGLFFVTYAVSQFVLGILISRVPARWVLGPTAILAALGTFYFSLSEGLTAAIIARALMGLASAVPLSASSTSWDGVMGTTSPSCPPSARAWRISARRRWLS